MKNSLKILVLILAVTVAGCMFGRAPDASQKKATIKVEQVQVQEKKLDKNMVTNLQQIAVLATGTDHALEKVKDPSREVDVAKELNDRVVSLAGQPSLKDRIDIIKIVDELISQVDSERKKGREALHIKDLELEGLQADRVAIQKELDVKNEELKKLTVAIAKENDKNAEVVGEMNSWFGLGAVFYGVKRFFISSIIVICIGGVIFFVLRLLASTNPIAAGIFAIFNTIGGVFMKAIKWITPGAHKVAGVVNESMHQTYKDVFLKVLDVLHECQDKQDTVGNQTMYKITDLMQKIDDSLDTDEQEVYDKSLAELRWTPNVPVNPAYIPPTVTKTI